MSLNNPLDRKTVEKIDSLLSKFETALENILYKHFNTTQDEKDISDIRDKLDFALHGETREEREQSMDEQWSVTEEENGQ